MLIATLEAPQYLLDFRQVVRSLKDIPSYIIINQLFYFIHCLHKDTVNITIDKIKKTDSKDLTKKIENRFTSI